MGNRYVYSSKYLKRKQKWNNFFGRKRLSPLPSLPLCHRGKLIMAVLFHLWFAEERVEWMTRLAMKVQTNSNCDLLR